MTSTSAFSVGTTDACAGTTSNATIPITKNKDNLFIFSSSYRIFGRIDIS
jgi:hypothetical protein